MAAIGGLHHVTAITGQATANLAFYTGVLGLRLVKKTVNQDDLSAYHLFYADGAGTPGTDLTFFDWPDAQPHQPGIPDLAPIGLRVGGPGALAYWQARLRELEVPHSDAAVVFGRLRLAFQDPEGQRLELVEDGGRPGGTPWSESPVPSEHAIKGLDGIGLVSARPEATVDFLTQVLGLRNAGEVQSAVGREYFLEAGDGGPGTEVRLLLPREAAPGRQGRGGVHHVAFRVPDEETQSAWRERLEAAGMRPTPIIDRFYFKSVYFREPGGNLFELATDGPGFTADEPLDRLGQALALPPFLEPDRARIEARLRPLR